MDLLQEGLYDKGILKAVFMAGGPGCGKSYVAKNLTISTGTAYKLVIDSNSVWYLIGG